MASLEDVERLALRLPLASEKTSYGNRAWAVRGKTFVWERPLGKSDLAALGAAAPPGPIAGVYTDGLQMKEAVLAADPKNFFTTPHFDGYPSVLIRLDAIPIARLEIAIVDSWIVRAPRTEVDAFLSGRLRSSARRRERG